VCRSLERCRVICLPELPVLFVFAPPLFSPERKPTKATVRRSGFNASFRCTIGQIGQGVHCSIKETMFPVTAFITINPPRSIQQMTTLQRELTCEARIWPLAVSSVTDGADGSIIQAGVQSVEDGSWAFGSPQTAHRKRGGNLDWKLYSEVACYHLGVFANSDVFPKSVKEELKTDLTKASDGKTFEALYNPDDGNDLSKWQVLSAHFSLLDAGSPMGVCSASPSGPELLGASTATHCPITESDDASTTTYPATYLLQFCGGLRG
jgi:hypothetical protein